ncbi:MAG: hypothetical protein F4118_00305 [Acidimicrobiaceae bacterium]|nr:hypothetical protein [Candidatus Poribacteria bacterium]MYI34863.1 hypothetical protein [Acidimicrobiaceae bacterium]
MEMRIRNHYGQVDYATISHGKSRDYLLCPVGLTLARMLADGSEIDVQDRYANIKQDEQEFKIALSTELSDWIDTYDNEVEVIPQEITLKKIKEEGFDYALDTKGYFDRLIVVNSREYHLQTVTAFAYIGSQTEAILSLSRLCWNMGTTWTQPEIHDAIIPKAQQAADFTMKDVALELVFVEDSNTDADKLQKKVYHYYFRPSSV